MGGLDYDLAVIANYEFVIPGTELTFPGITAVAVAIAVASASFVGTRVSSPSGVATTWFAFLFWGSFIISFVTLATIPLPGIEIWLSVFMLAATLLFAITLKEVKIKVIINSENITTFLEYFTFFMCLIPPNIYKLYLLD